MSSRDCQTGRSGSSSGFIVAHAAEYFVADAAAQGAQRLGPRVTGGQAVVEIGAAQATEPNLGDGDAVNGDVELAVATATQPMADGVARPDWLWRAAVVAGELGGRAEATDARRFADQLGRAQAAAAGQGEQRRCQLGYQAGDLALQAVDRGGQLANAGYQFAGDARDGAGQRDQPTVELA